VTLKKIAIQACEESVKLYIIVVHPSSVIIWKMVMRALSRLSKVTIP
jgi:hypothetical protein